LGDGGGEGRDRNSRSKAAPWMIFFRAMEEAPKNPQRGSRKGGPSARPRRSSGLRTRRELVEDAGLGPRLFFAARHGLVNRAGRQVPGKKGSEPPPAVPGLEAGQGSGRRGGGHQ